MKFFTFHVPASGKSYIIITFSDDPRAFNNNYHLEICFFLFYIVYIL